MPIVYVCERRDAGEGGAGSCADCGEPIRLPRPEAVIPWIRVIVYLCKPCALEAGVRFGPPDDGGKI